MQSFEMEGTIDGDQTPAGWVHPDGNGARSDLGRSGKKFEQFLVAEGEYAERLQDFGCIAQCSEGSMAWPGRGLDEFISFYHSVIE